MDEILIDEKKYISSKRAAKITGYAKDYVGQLCREGRVQAKLVGRSWYVLESAIQDYRFADTVKIDPSASDYEVVTPTSPMLPPLWKAQRHEVVAEKNELPIEKTISGDVLEEGSSWSAWLDIVAAEPTDTAVDISISDNAGPAQEVQEEQYKTDETLDRSEEPVKTFSKEKQISSRPPRNRNKSSWITVVFIRLIKYTAWIVALLSVGVVAMNSGYIDSYIYSFNQAGGITGISVYAK